MAYLPLLNPALGGGLGGMPERKVGTGTDTVSVGDIAFSTSLPGKKWIASTGQIVSADDYPKLYEVAGKKTEILNLVKTADPSGLVAGASQCVSISPDGQYIASAHSISPFIAFYKRSEDTFSKLADPASIPTLSPSSVAWSTDGLYVACACSSGTFLMIYKRSGDTFTKLTDPSPQPSLSATGGAYGVSFYSDYLIYLEGGAPFISIYKKSGDVFTKLANPASLPGSFANCQEWSADGGTLYLGLNSTQLIAYSRSGDVFTRLIDPSGATNMNSRSVAVSPDNVYIAVGGFTSPRVNFFKRTLNTFAKLPDLNYIPTSSVSSITCDPSGVYWSFHLSASPFVFFAKRSGDTFTKMSDVAQVPNSGPKAQWASDGSMLVIASNVPALYIYKFTPGVNFVLPSLAATAATLNANNYIDATPKIGYIKAKP